VRIRRTTRTDFFVSVLTYRELGEEPAEPGDGQLRCSPYSLFEVRLAERADMPRLILYERSTGFRPPRRNRPGETYVSFDRHVKERMPEQGQWDKVVRPKIHAWTEWARRNRAPVSYEQSMCAIALTRSAHDSQLAVAIDDCLGRQGYEPTRVNPTKHRSQEAFRLLREAGLVVADFNEEDSIRDQLYAAAHALGLPTIRLRPATLKAQQLPWILSGDPGGYQHDIVEWSDPGDLPPLIEPRIASMFRLSAALRDASGSNYLQSKRYSQFFVFLSHTLKPPQRKIVDEVYSLLKEKHVTPFEYHQVNTAGMDWKTALTEALQKTTHFIVLLSADYEQSETCMLELETILGRGDAVSVLPFMLAGRNRPNPKLGHLQNQLLFEADPSAAAHVVVKVTMDRLDAALRSAAPN
jgi:hypothetical protein